jgi:hypothetical protein
LSSPLSWVLLQASMFLVAIPIFNVTLSFAVYSAKNAYGFCS